MNYQSLAIIPARGGSKRITKKNIRPFLGKPIITYSIEGALKSACFDEVMVSTDDKKIASLSQSLGAKVPFMRTAKNSTDHSKLIDVVKEVLSGYKLLGKEFDYFCLIYPTAPFIKSKIIKQGLKQLKKSRADSIIPVVRFSYPIQRAFKIDSGRLKMINPKNIYIRSQDLMPTYKDSGLFVWARTKSFLKQGGLLTKNTLPLEVSEAGVHDIDTQEDWKIAEIKYKILKSK